MVKEKRILSNFIGWLIISLFICLIGIKNTYASEISQFDFMGKDFNSFWIEQNSYTSGTLSVTVSDITQIKPYINIIMASTYEPNFVVTSNNYFTDTWTRKLYSYGTTNVSGHTANVYVIQFSTKGLNNWNCSVDGTNCYVNTNIRMTGTSDYSSVFQLRSISLTDVVLDDDYLKNITVNQNNEIIDQNQTMIDQNQSIIQGQEKLEDAIVDSNKETQDVIKDQFNSCRDSENLIDKSTGTMTMYKLPKTLPAGTYTISFDNNNVSAGFRLSNTTDTSSNSFAITGLNINGNRQYLTITTTFEANYISLSTTISPKNIMLVSGNQVKYEPYGEEICTNKIDETNDALNNIGGALTDDSPTDMSGLENSIGWLPPGPVDSILTLPLALFNSLSKNLSNKTCITASLELPFVNKTLNLPCVKSLYEKIGITGTLFQTTGIIASCFILFNYLLALYKWIDDTLTLRENTMPGYYDDKWGGGA